MSEQLEQPTNPIPEGEPRLPEVPEIIPVPEHMQEQSGIRGLIANGRKREEAEAFRDGYRESMESGDKYGLLGKTSLGYIATTRAGRVRRARMEGYNAHVEVRHALNRQNEG